uniref:Pilus assembly protein n=1 Tax=Hydrogenovibrio crunogenus (strain DSM 25203 / XCL-2) TaxID=317025 RepID=Q31EV2_HYDCU
MIMHSKSLLGKQKGAVMLEAAYVLPVVLIVALLSVEAVNYASDRYSANNVLASLNESILLEASAVSSGMTASSPLVTCQNSQVVPNESAVQTLLNTNIANSQVGGAGNMPDGFQLNWTQQTVSGLLVYVVNISFPSKTLVLPESMAQSFPVKSNTIVTLGFSC